MPDQQIQNNIPQDLDEVLVKEPDGTFRVVKVAPTAAPVLKNTTPGVVSTPGVSAPLPRQDKPAPAAKVLDVDEEKEIAALSDKTQSTKPDIQDPTEQLTQRALQESGVGTRDPTLANRLTMLMVAYLKNVRNDLETRELLMRPKEQGGVGMTSSEAARLLLFLKTGGREVIVKDTTPGVVSTPGVNVSRSPAPTISKSPITKLPVEKPPTPTLPVAPKPITPVQQNSLPSKPPTSQQQPRQNPPKFSNENLGGPAPRLTPESKPLMQDVAPATKLTGPVEELRLRLTDWRRMAPMVKDRATKIEEKLRLLEEESYAERLKGVAAWYDGEVIRTYQQIAREALSQGKSVGSVCSEWQSAGKPSLTEEEFVSVAELNEKLRF